MFYSHDTDQILHVLTQISVWDPIRYISNIWTSDHVLNTSIRLTLNPDHHKARGPISQQRKLYYELWSRSWNSASFIKYSEAQYLVLSRWLINFINEYLATKNSIFIFSKLIIISLFFLVIIPGCHDKTTTQTTTLIYPFSQIVHCKHQWQF